VSSHPTKVQLPNLDSPAYSPAMVAALYVPLPLERCESLLAGVMELTARVLEGKQKWRAKPADADLLRQVASLASLSLPPDAMTRWPLTLGFLLSARFILDGLVADLKEGAAG
jgi:hypothetical protein